MFDLPHRTCGIRSLAWVVAILCFGIVSRASATSKLSCSPCSLAFGSVAVGSSKSLPIVFTNSGTSSITISSKIKNAAWVSPNGLALPYTLPAGKSVTFHLVYAPQDTRSVNGSFTYVSNASDPNLAIGVTGNGSSGGKIAPSPVSLNFGTVAVGSNKTLSETVSASGASVTIKSANLNSAEYSTSGLTLPLTLNAGQSVSFKVTFAPQSSGTANATMTFATNTSTSAAQTSLLGSGTGGSGHLVNLSWKASTSQVIGYNVYRGSKSGGPYSLITGSPAASTQYSDSSVQAGVTYYYVVTSVNNSGEESVYSNQASAAVP